MYTVGGSLGVPTVDPLISQRWGLPLGGPGQQAVPHLGTRGLAPRRPFCLLGVPPARQESGTVSDGPSGRAEVLCTRVHDVYCTVLYKHCVALATIGLTAAVHCALLSWRCTGQAGALTTRFGDVIQQ